MKIKHADDWKPERDAMLESLRELGRIWKHRPFDNKQGLLGVSAFALYWYVSRLRPSVVFESGVWKGFSTWLIEQAAPAAELHCFDPIFIIEPYLRTWRTGTYRSPRAQYSAQDFSCAPIRETVAGRSDALAFFDDHQNKLPRLLQCKEAGIKHIVFDDNLREEYTHRTLEHERAAGNPRLDEEIEVYEVFPALWPVNARLGDIHIREEGIGFPVESEFEDIYKGRHDYSYVTYVRLK